VTVRTVSVVECDCPGGCPSRHVPGRAWTPGMVRWEAREAGWSVEIPGVAGTPHLCPACKEGTCGETHQA
jgi:hypothetical protein